MKLLVLAGGFGSRLRAAVPDVPKALAPIGSVPFLQLQLENWIAQGLTDFTFMLHHKADQIIEFLKSYQDRTSRNVRISWLVEPTPMDTGGAIAYTVKTLGLKDEFLLTNADTWLGAGVYEIMQCPVPAIAVMNLLSVARYGQVNFDVELRVTSFNEKNGNCSAGWINTGLSHLSAELFNDWDGQPFSLERGLFDELVQKRRLAALPLQTDFIDIGVPEDYHRFCRWVRANRRGAL